MASRARGGSTRFPLSSGFGRRVQLLVEEKRAAVALPGHRPPPSREGMSPTGGYHRNVSVVGDQDAVTDEQLDSAANYEEVCS